MLTKKIKKNGRGELLPALEAGLEFISCLVPCPKPRLVFAGNQLPQLFMRVEGFTTAAYTKNVIPELVIRSGFRCFQGAPNQSVNRSEDLVA